MEQPILRKKNGRIAAGIQYFPKEFHWPISPFGGIKSPNYFQRITIKPDLFAEPAFSVNMKLFRTKPIYFDQDFFMYYEDQEWSIRLRESGHLFAVNSRVAVIHGESLSSGGGIQWPGVLMRWHGLNVFLDKIGATLYPD